MSDDTNVEVWRLLRHPTHGSLLDDPPQALTQRDLHEILRACRGAELASVIANSVPYGEAFKTLALDASTFNDLIVRMTLAGRVDICETGLLLAMRAAHRVILRSVELHGCSNGWADVFREWSEVAEHLAADLEHRYAEDLLAEDSGEMVHLKNGKTRARQAEAARARAARARQRRDEARSDTAASLAERGRSADEIATTLGPPY